MDTLGGVVLSGGQSRRIGRDKSLMSLGGRTLIERVLDALRPLCSETILVTNTPERYDFLGVPCVPDLVPGAGALGGLHAGLSAATTDRVVAVACDMPFLNTTLLRYLAERAYEPDAVVPDLSDAASDTGSPIRSKPTAKQLDLQPLHAVYRRACLSPIRAQLEAGDFRMVGFLEHIRVSYVGRADIVRFDPELYSFFNVNTPEEWSTAERIAARMLAR